LRSPQGGRKAALLAEFLQAQSDLERVRRRFAALPPGIQDSDGNHGTPMMGVITVLPK
jgi:hypothetical protein